METGKDSVTVVVIVSKTIDVEVACVVVEGSMSRTGEEIRKKKRRAAAAATSTASTFVHVGGPGSGARLGSLG